MGFADRIERTNASMMARLSGHRAVVGPGAADSVRVLYDAPFRMAEAYEGQVETSSPACSMADSDVLALGIEHGSFLTIMKDEPGGSSFIGDFEVIGVEPDNLGMTRLILAKER